MKRVYHSAAASSVVNSLSSLTQRSSVSRSNYRIRARALAWMQRSSLRALCVGLALSLLINSTPAAAQTTVGVFAESRVSLGFWLRANKYPERLSQTLRGQGTKPKPQETQPARDARVASIRIFPGDVTIGVDAQVAFAAVGYDQHGEPVGGVTIKWSGHHVERKRAVSLSPRGNFQATAPGSFKITAEGAGKTAVATVTVLPGVRRHLTDVPLNVIPVSSRDLPAGEKEKSNNKSARGSSYLAKAPAKAKSARISRQQRAHAPRQNKLAHGGTLKRSPAITALPLEPEGGWGGDNYWSADDPGNGRGDPPGHPLDHGAGSGNFKMLAPVLDLPGRGIDLSLGLAYNSRVWNKAGTQINFDIDRDWPAPGWSLGFPKVVDLGLGGSMIVDPDGTRHSFSGDVTPYSNGAIDFRGHTADGTLIDYGSYRHANGMLVWAEVNRPDGSQIHYSCLGPGGMYPTQVTDANGNYITITYVNNTGPRIQTITDTLNRVVTFHYDQYNLLTAISAPGLEGGTRTLVRLHYRQLSLTSGSYSFSGLTPIVRDPGPWVIDAIYYPGTNSGYWFGDTDSYSSYGMLAKVIEQRGMSFSAASLEEQGTVTQGQMTRRQVYNYPMLVGDSGGTASTNLTNAPTYTTLTETWTRDGVLTDQAVTTYDVNENANPRTQTITLPNGTKNVQSSHNAPGNYLDGLVFLDQTLDTNDTLLMSSNVTWEQGAYDAARPSRIEAINHEINKKTAAVFQYGPVYNQVIGTYNYDLTDPANTPAVLLAATRTQYENSPSYTTNRHIFNLPLIVEAFAADNTTRVSRTEYQYDGQTLVNTPGVPKHSALFDPYTTEVVGGNQCCDWDPEAHHCFEYCVVSAYNPITNYRGNVTQVTTYADAVNLTSPSTETRRYDITGNQVTASSSCCEQMSIVYTIDTKYAYPESQTRGSATDPNAQLTTSATYDFNTGLGLSGKNANGRATQATYAADTLRPQSVILPSGGHTEYVYDDTVMTVMSTTYLAPPPADTGEVVDQHIQFLNGLGQVWREKALGANDVWDILDTVYDNMGRMTQHSRPYRSGTPRWSYTSYDALSRTKKVIAPDYTLSDGSDGSATELFYNEATRPSVASSLPGETTRVRDAWGRERWGRLDAQGRLVEVVEPNPSGSGSVFEAGALQTTYSYNTVGDLIQVNQDAQTRLFKYDSLRRLVGQKLAETSAAINDSGAYVGVGGAGAMWSDYFRYENIHSNMVQRLDARGVKTNFWYFNSAGHTDPGDGTTPDPLNRLQSISWDTSIANQNLQPTDPKYVLNTATVTPQYRNRATSTSCDPTDASGRKDVTQVTSANVASISTESYCFDLEGRTKSKTLTLTARSSFPMATDYSYDTLDRVTDVGYPAEYGNGSAQARKVVHQSYDVASRLSTLTVDGVTHASQIAYNPSSRMTSVNVGASGPNQIVESYAYDAHTGLLANQTVARSSSPGSHLLDLTYDYAAANGKRTGQLTKILNNLSPNHNKDRSYSYDALGRLAQAQGGLATAPLWTQTYGYDKYGNRTSVSANGYSAKLDSKSTSGSERLATANRSTGSTVTGRPLDVVESSTANTQSLTSVQSGSVDPGVPQAPDVSAPNAEAPSKEVADSIAGPSKLANSYRQMTAGNSHHASRSTRTVPSSPQGGPPTFTDPDLLAPGGVAIKALHITELRSAIDALRVRLGSSVFSWQTAAASGGPTKADPILEMRTALDQVLGPPAAPGYSAGLAQYQPVLAIHIQELRNRVVANWNTQISIPVDGHANLSYDTATNRITTAGFDYDAAGNQIRALISAGVSQRFQYDAANRLIKVKADDNVTVLATYTYGDTKERLIAEEGGVRTYYSCGGTAEYTEGVGSTTPQWSKSNIYLGMRLLSTLTPNGSGGAFVQYHHPDRLGTRLVTNAQDANSFEQVTLPFGTALNAESTIATNRRFTSYDRSSNTGLDYAVNRQYDSRQGRFTQVDPIGMAAVSLTSPQSLNLYAYCGNDPVNRTDPSGLFWGKLFRFLSKALKWIGIAVMVAAVVMSGPFAPASGTMLAHILGALVKLGAIIGQAMNFIAGGVILAEGATAIAAATIGAFGLLAASTGFGAAAQRQSRRRKHRKLEIKDPIVARIVDLITGLAVDVTQRQLDKYKEEVKAHQACVNQKWDIYKAKAQVLDKLDVELQEIHWWDFLEALKPETQDKRWLKRIEMLKKHERLMREKQEAADQRDKDIKNCKEPTFPPA